MRKPVATLDWLLSRPCKAGKRAAQAAKVFVLPSALDDLRFNQTGKVEHGSYRRNSVRRRQVQSALTARSASSMSSGVSAQWSLGGSCPASINLAAVTVRMSVSHSAMWHGSDSFSQEDERFTSTKANDSRGFGINRSSASTGRICVLFSPALTLARALSGAASFGSRANPKKKRNLLP